MNARPPVVLRCLLCAAVVLAATGPALAVDAALYNQANALYRQGHYAEAVARYEALVGQGVRNADLYYNLGNAYYKAGEIGKAVLNYQRARQLAPDDPDILANLKFVNAVKRDQIEGEPHNLVTRAVYGVYAWLSADGLSTFLSVCLFAAAAVGIGWLYAPRRKVLWLTLLLVVGMGGLASAGILALKIHQREAVRRAVILADEALARSGPGQDYLQVFSVHEGTTVVIEREEADWTLVRLPNGVGGWVPGKSLEAI